MSDQTNQRPMRRSNGTLDPEALVPTSPRKALVGPFRNDILSISWKMTYRRQRKHCRSEEELLQHHQEAIRYLVEKDKPEVMPIVLPSLIAGKAGLLIIDAARRRPTPAASRDSAQIPTIDNIADHHAQDAACRARVNEAAQILIRTIDAYYAGPPQPLLRGPWIGQAYAERLEDQANGTKTTRLELREEVVAACGCVATSLEFAAQKFIEVTAALYCECGTRRETKEIEPVLQRFVAARDSTKGRFTEAYFAAYWLIEWGWTVKQACEIVGLPINQTTRTYCRDFRNLVEARALEVRLSVELLKKYIPKRRY